MCGNDYCATRTRLWRNFAIRLTKFAHCPTLFFELAGIKFAAFEKPPTTIHSFPAIVKRSRLPPKISEREREVTN